MSRAEWGTVSAIVPDDDAIWQMRSASQQAITLRLGISRYALRDVVRPRGWAWHSGGRGVAVAPCRACHAPTPAEELTDARDCRGCDDSPPIDDAEGLTPNRQVARDEYAKRRKRIGTPEWLAKYQRVGGPETRVAA